MIPDAFYYQGIAKFVTYCLGMSSSQVNRIRAAYRTNLSLSANPLRRVVEAEYTMTILNLHPDQMDQMLWCNSNHIPEVPSAPHVLLLGDDFHAPYTREFVKWLKWARPSVIRVQQRKVAPANLPSEEYYIGTCAVLSDAELDDSISVSSEIDYGTLVYMNFRRYVKQDDKAVLICTPEESAALSEMIASSVSDSSFATAGDTHAIERAAMGLPAYVTHVPTRAGASKWG